MLCSLVQPSPELLDLFDRVMLMSKGRCVYFGPRDAVSRYFFGLGYQMPADAENKSEPDWLEEVSLTPEDFYQSMSALVLWCSSEFMAHTLFSCVTDSQLCAAVGRSYQ